MKVRNESERNISVMAPRIPGSMIFRLNIPALTTMQFTDDDWGRVKDATKDLIEKGVLKVLDAPESKKTVEEIVEKIEKEVDVKVSPKKSKKKVQKIAEDLGVNV